MVPARFLYGVSMAGSDRSSFIVRALAAAGLALGLYTGARPVGPVPALGPFLDPANGVWASASVAELPESSSATIPGLAGAVTVVYDERAVPHIFATSIADAHRALGYVVARDRLFQLELQTLAASGRLTEIAGERALNADRVTRELGMPRAAEQKWAALNQGSESVRFLQAYADGVNAWIDEMTPRDLPFEFRLTEIKPSRWHPINSIHLLNRMGRTLMYSESDIGKLAVQARVGRAAAEALFPMNAPIQDPIQPNGSSSPRFDVRRLPPPGVPDTQALLALRTLSALSPSMASTNDGNAIGSNNWAVSPRRTAAGHALLAGDPHLELTLPSVWYEAHLVVPGQLDAYGVTIPGAAGLIIGFNRDIAWTFTNTGADVNDYYAETVDDSTRPTTYMLDGEWRPLELRLETYRDKTGSIIAIDTLRFTHRGPLRRANDRWVSLRWTVLDLSNETAAFLGAALSKSVTEFQAAMSSYRAPAQNMLVADRAGIIAIRSNGLFPIRPGDGRGDSIRDGTTRASDWLGFWPIAEYPQSLAPQRGFLSSANQQPLDPRTNPRYLGADWPTPWRAIRINTLLRGDSALTPEAMRRFQTDPTTAKAAVFVPAFLAAVARQPQNEKLARAARLLAQWDGRYTKHNERAVLFEYAMDEVTSRLWDELHSSVDSTPDGPMPNHAAVFELLQDSASLWWDDRQTRGRVEGRDEILIVSLETALEKCIRDHGEPDGGGWRWDRIRHANIHHLLRLPALSALGISVQGGPSSLNPSSGSGTHGASWRMVVEMGPEVRGWGTYPGGQSGNPASRRYKDRLEKWSIGELDTLRFPRRAGDLSAGQVSARLTLTPRR